MEDWANNIGMMENWNNGMLGKSSFRGLRSSHHSITPLFQFSFGLFLPHHSTIPFLQYSVLHISEGSQFLHGIDILFVLSPPRPFRGF